MLLQARRIIGFLYSLDVSKIHICLPLGRINSDDNTALDFPGNERANQLMQTEFDWYHNLLIYSFLLMEGFSMATKYQEGFVNGGDEVPSDNGGIFGWLFINSDECTFVFLVFNWVYRRI